MVRETRYLWVGDLPEKTTEDQIAEHFQQYGKIQSIKLLPAEGDSRNATVAFMDIKSASKAHNTENEINGVIVVTGYSEPTGSGSITVTRTVEHQEPPPSRLYNQNRQSGRYSSRNEGPGQEDGNYDYYSPAGRDYDGQRSRSYEGNNDYSDRHRNKFQDSRDSFRRGQGDPPNRQQYDQYYQDRPPDQRWQHRSRVQSPAHSDISQISQRQRVQSTVHRRSISRSPGSRHGSRSSSSSSSGSSTSSSNTQSRGSRTPGKGRKKKLESQIAHAPTMLDEGTSGERKERADLGICIKGLPLRSSDTSLRDGLFHEYKKHGKVTSVNISGEGGERYAIISFSKPEDAAKALEHSKGKTFFGTKIQAASHEGFEVEDRDFKPPEQVMDEYHPKATRTLFIGNLEKDITTQDLDEYFKDFGVIIDIDIKKQGAVSSYAFVQYDDIKSVVRAMRKMDGEHIGANKIKLGFGKSMPTTCVWMDCLAESVKEKLLCRQFNRYGAISHAVIDGKRGRALVYFDSEECAKYAVDEMRGRAIRGKKIQIDFASRACQNAFFEEMEKTGQLAPGERPDERSGKVFRKGFSSQFEDRGSNYESSSGGSSSRTGSSGGYNNFDRSGHAQGNYRTSAGISRPFRGRTAVRGRRGRGGFFEGGSFEEDGFHGSSRKRGSFDDYDSQSGNFEDNYEQELREYGFSQKERRDSTLSPPRSRDGRGSPSYSRSSRHPSPSDRPDPFGDQYSDREHFERFRDTDSQSGEKESVRSHHSVRSEKRDFRSSRQYSDERFVSDKYVEVRDRTPRGFSPTGSEFSRRSRSPTRYGLSSPRRLKERTDRDTPPTPIPDEYSQPGSPSDFDISSKDTVSKSKQLDYEKSKDRFEHSVKAKIPSKIGRTFSDAERTKSRRSSTSRVYHSANSSDGEYDRTLKSEIEKPIKKRNDDLPAQYRQETSWSMDIDGPQSDRLDKRSRTVTKKPEDPLKMDYHEWRRRENEKLERVAAKLKEVEQKHKKDKVGDEKYDPFDNNDSDSDSKESDNVSSEPPPTVGISDVNLLQKEKEQILNQLKQLEETGSPSDNDLDEDGRPRKKPRLEAGEYRSSPLEKQREKLSRQLGDKMGNGPDSSSHDLAKFRPIDTTQSFRKQMEARRRQEEAKTAGQNESPSPNLFPHPPTRKDNQVEIGLSEGPKEIPAEFLPRKKRKTDVQSDQDSLKRSYRNKHSTPDLYGLSDEELLEHNSKEVSSKKEEKMDFEFTEPKPTVSQGSSKSSPSEPKKDIRVPLEIKTDCKHSDKLPKEPRTVPDSSSKRSSPISLPLPKFARQCSALHTSSPKASPKHTSPGMSKIASPPFSPGVSKCVTSPQLSPATSMKSEKWPEKVDTKKDKSESTKSDGQNSKLSEDKNSTVSLPPPPPPPPPPAPPKQEEVKKEEEKEKEEKEKEVCQSEENVKDTKSSIEPEKDAKVDLMPKEEKVEEEKPSENKESQENECDTEGKGEKEKTDSVEKELSEKENVKKETEDSEKKVSTPALTEPVVSKPFESSDSELSEFGSPKGEGPSLDERIRALDEKLSLAGANKPAESTTTSSVLDYREKYRIRKRVDSTPIVPNITSSISDMPKASEPSDIMLSLLKRGSVFDQDEKRLEQINEKYEPKEVTLDDPPLRKFDGEDDDMGELIISEDLNDTNILMSGSVSNSDTSPHLGSMYGLPGIKTSSMFATDPVKEESVPTLNVPEVPVGSSMFSSTSPVSAANTPIMPGTNFKRQSSEPILPPKGILVHRTSVSEPPSSAPPTVPHSSMVPKVENTIPSKSPRDPRSSRDPRDHQSSVKTETSNVTTNPGNNKKSEVLDTNSSVKKESVQHGKSDSSGGHTGTESKNLQAPYGGTPHKASGKKESSGSVSSNSSSLGKRKQDENPNKDSKSHVKSETKSNSHHKGNKSGQGEPESKKSKVHSHKDKKVENNVTKSSSGTASSHQNVKKSKHSTSTKSPEKKNHNSKSETKNSDGKSNESKDSKTHSEKTHKQQTSQEKEKNEKKEEKSKGDHKEGKDKGHKDPKDRDGSNGKSKHSTSSSVSSTSSSHNKDHKSEKSSESNKGGEKQEKSHGEKSQTEKSKSAKSSSHDKKDSSKTKPKSSEIRDKTKEGSHEHKVKPKHEDKSKSGSGRNEKSSSHSKSESKEHKPQTSKDKHLSSSSSSSSHSKKLSSEKSTESKPKVSKEHKGDNNKSDKTDKKKQHDKTAVSKNSSSSSSSSSKEKHDKEKDKAKKEKDAKKEKEEKERAELEEIRKLAEQFEAEENISMYDKIKRRSNKQETEKEKSFSLQRSLSQLKESRRRKSGTRGSDFSSSASSSDESSDDGYDQRKREKADGKLAKPRKNFMSTSTSDNSSEEDTRKKKKSSKIMNSSFDSDEGNFTHKIQKKKDKQPKKKTVKKSSLTIDSDSDSNDFEAFMDKTRQDTKKSKVGKGIYTDSDSDSSTASKPKVGKNTPKSNKKSIKPLKRENAILDTSSDSEEETKPVKTKNKKRDVKVTPKHDLSDDSDDEVLPPKSKNKPKSKGIYTSSSDSESVSEEEKPVVKPVKKEKEKVVPKKHSSPVAEMNKENTESTKKMKPQKDKVKEKSERPKEEVKTPQKDRKPKKEKKIDGGVSALKECSEKTEHISSLSSEKKKNNKMKHRIESMDGEKSVMKDFKTSQKEDVKSSVKSETINEFDFQDDKPRQEKENKVKKAKKKSRESSSKSDKLKQRPSNSGKSDNIFEMMKKEQTQSNTQEAKIEPVTEELEETITSFPENDITNAIQVQEEFVPVSVTEEPVTIQETVVTDDLHEKGVFSGLDKVNTPDMPHLNPKEDQYEQSGIPAVTKQIKPQDVVQVATASVVTDIPTLTKEGELQGLKMHHKSEGISVEKSSESESEAAKAKAKHAKNVKNRKKKSEEAVNEGPVPATSEYGQMAVETILPKENEIVSKPPEPAKEPPNVATVVEPLIDIDEQNEEERERAMQEAQSAVDNLLMMEEYGGLVYENPETEPKPLDIGYPPKEKEQTTTPEKHDAAASNDSSVTPVKSEEKTKRKSKGKKQVPQIEEVKEDKEDLHSEGELCIAESPQEEQQQKSPGPNMTAASSPRTRSVRKQEEEKDVTPKMSSRGRKIIPKDQDEEFVSHHGKGKRMQDEQEPKGKGRRSAPHTPPASDSELSKAKTKGRRLSGKSDDDFAAKVEDTISEVAREIEEQKEETHGTPQTGKKSTRRKSQRKNKEEKEEMREDHAEEGKVNEPKTEMSSLDATIDSVAGQDSETTTKTQKRRKSKTRKSLDMGSPRGRSQAEDMSASPKGKGPEGAESTSPREYSKPFVKLEKLPEHTWKKDDPKRDEHGREEVPNKKDLYDWDDDDDQPLPELTHKRPRKRKLGEGPLGPESPRSTSAYDEVSMDSTCPMPDFKRHKEDIKSDGLRIDGIERLDAVQNFSHVKLKEEAKPIVKAEVKVPEKPALKEHENEVQPHPIEPGSRHGSISDGPRHLPLKLAMKEEHAREAAVAAASTAMAVQTTPPSAPPKQELTPRDHKSSTSSSSSVPNTPLTPSHIPAAWEINMDKVLDDVAKGNFERGLEYDFYAKQRQGRSASRESPSLYIASPSPGISEPAQSPSRMTPPAQNLHGTPQVFHGNTSQPVTVSSSGSGNTSMSPGLASHHGMPQIVQQPGHGHQRPHQQGQPMGMHPMHGMPPYPANLHSPRGPSPAGPPSIQMPPPQTVPEKMSPQMRSPTGRGTPTSVIQQPHPQGIPPTGQQNPMLELQKAGYRVTETSQPHPERERLSPRQASERKHSQEIKASHAVPPTSVQLGVVPSQAYGRAHREASPPGQIIEKVPNPHMRGMPNNQMDLKPNHPPARQEQNIPHHLPQGHPGAKEQAPRQQPSPQFPGGPHYPYPHPHPGAMVSQAKSESSSSPSTSELRAALAQPSRLMQQEQMLQQQRIQMGQPPSQMSPGSAQPTERPPHQPMLAQHRMPFTIQEPRSAGSRAEPKVSHPSYEAHPVPPHSMPHFEGKVPTSQTDARSANAQSQSEQWMQQEASRLKSIYGQLPPGIPPYGPGGIPMNIPRMAMDPRMFAQSQHPEFLAQQLQGLPQQHAHLLAQQQALQAEHERQPGSRPPSRLTPPSAQPSPHAPSTPHQGPQTPAQASAPPTQHMPQQGTVVQQQSPGSFSSMQPTPAMMRQNHEIPPGESFLSLLPNFPVMWQGALALKNDSSNVQMHFVAGSQVLVKLSLPPMGPDGLSNPLRIAQRMRLDPTHLDGVSRRMTSKDEFSMLIALPCGHDHMEVLQQTKSLSTGFIDYLSKKQAAGIVNVPGPQANQPAYVVHIFPPCEYTQSLLARLSPALLQSMSEISHLVIIIATV